MILPPCPACGATFSVDVWLANHDARLFVVAISKAPPDLVSRIPGYLGLFRPTGGSVGWAQAVKILQDLIDLVTPGQVVVKGVMRPSPPEIWVKSIDQLISQKAKVDLPLASHGYLLSIVREMADKEDAANERRRDDRRLRKQEHPTHNQHPHDNNSDDDDWIDKRCSPITALAIRLANAYTETRIDSSAYATLLEGVQGFATTTGHPLLQEGYCSLCRYHADDGQVFIGQRISPVGAIMIKLAQDKLTDKIDLPSFNLLTSVMDSISKVGMTKPAPEFCLHICPCRNQAS